MDPRHRLHRRYPGQGLCEPRPIELHLWARDRTTQPERTAVGETVHLQEVRVRSVRRKANPRPNAPLLKRLVRYPYRLHTGRPHRRQLVEPFLSARLRVESSMPAARIAQEARGRMVMGNPLRAYPTRLYRRAGLPSVDDWLDGGRR